MSADSMFHNIQQVIDHINENDKILLIGPAFSGKSYLSKQLNENKQFDIGYCDLGLGAEIEESQKMKFIEQLPKKKGFIMEMLCTSPNSTSIAQFLKELLQKKLLTKVVICQCPYTYL